MSFDISTAFATDESLENEGAKFPLSKGSHLLVARAGNRRYSRALSKAVEQRRLELDVGPGSTEADADAAAAVSDEILINVMASTILVGWGGLSLKGEDLGEYSEEKARRVLAIKDFRKHVAGLSEQMDAYKVKEEVEAGKT
jgi:hypothetical protein